MKYFDSLQNVFIMSCKIDTHTVHYIIKDIMVRGNLDMLKQRLNRPCNKGRISK